MRGFILVLLVCLLPLQFSWAAVAPYCGHEASPQAQHVGHHAHEHHEEPTLVLDAESSLTVEPSPWTADLDCAQCHASGAVPSGVEESVHVTHGSAQPSPLAALMAGGQGPGRPDRPQWLYLA
jgi:hypothetical protein